LAITAFGGAVAFAGYGCGTDAVGIDACRQIEAVRCDVAPACKGDEDTFGINTEEQIANCKTLYLDHCLLGLENPDAEEPSQSKAAKCIKAIKAAADCKKAKVETMADCEDAPVIEGQTELTPCQALHEVEKLQACTFVKKPEKKETTTA